MLRLDSLERLHHAGEGVTRPAPGIEESSFPLLRNSRLRSHRGLVHGVLLLRSRGDTLGRPLAVVAARRDHFRERDGGKELVWHAAATSTLALTF